MARPTKRSRQSRRTARLDFAAIEIVGGLLPPEVVTRIAAFDMPDQSEESYGILRGLKLRDEIARFYQIALAHWERFDVARAGNASAPQTFVLELLRDCFGFANIEGTGVVSLSGRSFPIRHAAHGEKTPIVIAPTAPADSRRTGVDELLTQFGDETRRRSATQLLQEYLNADESALWGLASDGCTLRLMRDNASLTRPAWIEANLEKIFTEGLFADFSALWLLIHASRFGGVGAAPSDCPLERWRERGRIDGSAAKEKLRLGVEAALLELGRGFLENPANTALRERLQSGDLTRQAYYEYLLRLVYRLIFLFAAEDRDLLHAPVASEFARKTYRNGYSVGRLRERCTKSASLDRHHDAWDGLRALFNALARGEPRLGVAALGGLFAPTNLFDLAGTRIANRRLLKAIWHLAWFRPEGQPMTRVNWRDMETEELGSVYESLLELIPVVNVEARHFDFTIGDAANKGNERKTTGSYYTPDSLVQLLLTTTLDPVLDAAEARNSQDPASEILKLSIIDPACGSGHFLLGAARRAASRIAKARGVGSYSRDDYQHALREVVSHCIYGVDRNPMAVELCKVALWIEALEPGRPLTFLDNHILCGDSLIGVFDYRMLRKGLPDEAFDPLTGDDKAVAKAYAAINKEQRDGKTASGFLSELRMPAEITSGAEKLLAMPEDTLEEVEAKRKAFKRLISGQTWWQLKSACDMYVSAFLMPKQGDLPDPRKAASLPVPTTEAIWRMVQGGDIRGDVQAAAIDLAERNRAFHWPLEFPAVMAKGGFDAVVGNPPWERIKLLEQEFFASRDLEIATAPTKNERDRLIKELMKAEPGSPQARLSKEFELAKRASEAASIFVRKSGRFPMTGTGDVNTYALFAEHFARLARTPQPSESSGRVIIGGAEGRPLPPGRAGVIVPTGIATDNSTSAFFGNLVEHHRLAALYSFYEVRRWFKDTDERKSFCIFVIGAHRREIMIVVNIENIDEIHDNERQVLLGAQDFRLFNPNTLTAPLFRARYDRELTRKLYQATPVMIRKRPEHPDGDDNPWGITFQTLFHMSNDSGHFRTAEQLSGQGFLRDGLNWRHADGRLYVPLYEAKMVHHFDHRHGSFEGLEKRPGDGSLPEATDAQKASPSYEAEPWSWVPSEENALRVARLPPRLKQYYRKEKPEGCLKVLAEWVLGTLDPDDLDPANLARSTARASNRLRDVLGQRALSRDIVGPKIATWLGKVAAGAREMQRETPLSVDDLAFIKEGPSDPMELTGALTDFKQPRWLIGWRDITNAASERTVNGCVLPLAGVGNNLPLWHPNGLFDPRLISVLVANLSSIPLDYAARQKVAGTHLNYFYAEQLPVLAPHQFTPDDIAFVAPRVLELTFTSYSMRQWAEDLGHFGSPFGFDSERRALLRAELDAFFARKYNLTRDELRYMLDPTDIRGEGYPSETFRLLKRYEIDRYGTDERGYYRTQRLVLEAFDRLTGMQIGEAPIRIEQPPATDAPPPDLAWERPAQPHAGDTGAVLAAILKAMAGPKPIRDVRLTAALALEPRLLVPLVSDEKAAEWRRLIGPEADPLAGNVAAFATRVNAAWGGAVRNHRGNGRLVEDTANGTWAPGTGLDAIDTTGWPDGRVGFVLETLKNINLGVATTSLPDDIQEWIADVAAA
ncbi:N-6 DNA methylase [Tistrella mobilis]|uniref:Eco57I restriction-modification methylase domain-containing protein n=1 Tax=Tistrella mobilis TaxID=171437 RepID=UPI0035577FCD